VTTEAINGHALPSYTVRVETPDGTMFVNIVENGGNKPIMVDIHIGKVGQAVSSWADALGRAITLGLENNIPLYKMLEVISNITTSSLRVLSKGTICRSGPEGVAIAIMKYQRSKDGK
jgi:hypothetical protein